MRLPAMIGFVLAATVASASAQQHGPGPGFARPDLVLQQIVEGMPKEERQAVRILTATFKPGDKTVTHTHRFPVAVYVLEGAFALELKGREPTTVKAGEGMMEPPNVEMTGFNRSTTEATRVVIFYVSTPETPFLDMLH